MALDPKQIAEWKREGPGLVSDPVSTWEGVVAPLLAEVERLRSEAGLVRDPAGGEPPSWVRIEVRAHDPEQRKRTAEWIRRADEDNAAMRALLREVEWGAETYLGFDYSHSACPICGGVRPNEWGHYDDALDDVRAGKTRKGHAPGCRLAAFLR
jgi:hypothetical protein